MSIVVTLPRGFDTYAHRPRIVVEDLPGAIRMHYARSAAEAMLVREAWCNSDYARWPGQVRLFPEL